MVRVLRRARESCGAVCVALLLSAPIIQAAGSSLIQAVKDRNASAVRQLLARHADVNARQPDGGTPLHWAAHRNDVEIATLLVSAGAQVNAQNDLGATPLWLACLNGSPAMVDVLLRAGANPNVALPSGERPLMTAARTGNVAVVRALIDAGAELEAAEQGRGQTALMWAVSKGQIDVARVLIEQGASVNAASAAGFSPLMFAARQGSVDMGALLLAHGADVNRVDSTGNDALLVAVVRGQLPFARLMLDHGAKPNAMTAGYTPLHWASTEWASQLNFDYQVDEGEWSVLGGLPGNKRIDAIKMLLAYGADVNARVAKGPSRYGAPSMVKAAYVVGGTPFLLASTAADVEMMRLLLANGADYSITTTDGTTPLMLAAGLTHYDAESRAPEAKHLEAVKLLVSLGADVNAANSAGNTALHGGAFGGFNSVIEYLVSRGAQLNVKNKEGQTPLAMAEGIEVGMMVYSRPATAAVLLRLGAGSDTAPLSGEIVLKKNK
jgi:ankyrin repeat protein